MRRFVTVLLVLAAGAGGTAWWLDGRVPIGPRSGKASASPPAGRLDPVGASETAPVAGARRFSREAMGAKFETIIADADPDLASAAAGAAFDELNRLAGLLDRRSAGGDVARINAARRGEPVHVGPEVLDCLWAARRIHLETRGAFDATAGRLIDCWRRPDGRERPPTEAEFAAARAASGMALLDISMSRQTVTVHASGVIVDLGDLADGYALDRMAAVLTARGVSAALLSDGFTTLATEAPAGRTGWPVRLVSPGGESMPTVLLAGEALSGSGALGRNRPIVDPRTGTLAAGKTGVWVIAKTAATADALSTAFMVMRTDEVRSYCTRDGGVSALLIGASGNGPVHLGPAWRGRP